VTIAHWSLTMSAAKPMLRPLAPFLSAASPPINLMRIARVIGRLNLARADASLTGARYLIAIPLSLDCLRTGEPSSAEELVVYDEMGASEGQLIVISESAEAAAPFHPQQKPVDAYCAAILDTMELD